MRAFAIDGLGDIAKGSVRELEAPTPAAGQVLVRVRASSVNNADYLVGSGAFAGKLLHASKRPLVLGYDFSGEVEAVGAGVSELAAGDAVYGHLPYAGSNRQGAFAELLLARADEVAKKPDGVSHIDAACMATVGCTTLQALRDKGGIAPGARVVINGASGGVGSYAVQVAALDGAEVTALCSASKMGFVEALGAERVVDYRKTPLTALDGKFDLILDAACSSSYGASAHLLTDKGVYVTLLPSLGLVTGLLRSALSRKACRFVTVKSRRADLELLARWSADGKLRASVDSTFGLDEVPEAIQRFRSGEVKGKVAVTLEG